MSEQSKRTLERELSVLGDFTERLFTKDAMAALMIGAFLIKVCLSS